MRQSRVLRKLQHHQPVLVITLHLSDTCVFELASLMGFDGIWLDLEHGNGTKFNASRTSWSFGYFGYYCPTWEGRIHATWPHAGVRRPGNHVPEM